MYNPWLVLGVNRQSSDEEVRSAYLALVRKHHPDMKKGNADKCALINEAYNILKHKETRSALVKQMIIVNKECTTCRGTGATFKQSGVLHRITTTCRMCGGSGVIIKQRR